MRSGDAVTKEMFSSQRCVCQGCSITNKLWAKGLSGPQFLIWRMKEYCFKILSYPKTQIKKL